MRPVFQRLLRAILVGLALGGIALWWIRRGSQQTRIGEVRRRVMPGLTRELRARGFDLGDPVFFRVFKESREAELWLQPRGESRFKLWKTHAVAGMSGQIGPKLTEGDAQAPEGFYEVAAPALNPNSAFHLSFNIGYPNAFDRAHDRTGSWIMVHGGTESIGCFAMTDPAIEEIYLVCEAALQRGQPAFAVHVFPFRMTDERMAAAATSEWLPFWENLREGYARFEETRVPPPVRLEEGRYAF